MTTCGSVAVDNRRWLWRAGLTRSSSGSDAAREGLRIYNLFPTARRHDCAMGEASAADRGNAVQYRLSQSLPLSGVLRQPLCRQGLLSSQSAVPRAARPATTICCCAVSPKPRVLTGFGSSWTSSSITHRETAFSSLNIRDWFARDAAGDVVSPFATDPADPSQRTVWGDLAELDYRSPQQGEILAYFKRLAQHYIGLGFAGFRCDAAYKVPATVWRGLIGAVKAASPAARVLRRELWARRRRPFRPRRCRLRLPVQQRQMVGFREPVAARPI